jgi:hypothetical protein
VLSPRANERRIRKEIFPSRVISLQGLPIRRELAKKILDSADSILLQTLLEILLDDVTLFPIVRNPQRLRERLNSHLVSEQLTKGETVKRRYPWYADFSGLKNCLDLLA